MIDPAEPTVRTFTEKRESTFTLSQPLEITGRKLSPRPRYSSCRISVNLNLHVNSILFTTSIWQAQRRRPIVTSDTDIFSTSKRHLRPSKYVAYIANRYRSIPLSYISIVSNSIPSAKTNHYATPSKVITARVLNRGNSIVSEMRSSNSIRNRLRTDSKLGRLELFSNDLFSNANSCNSRLKTNHCVTKTEVIFTLTSNRHNGFQASSNRFRVREFRTGLSVAIPSSRSKTYRYAITSKVIILATLFTSNRKKLFDFF